MSRPCPESRRTGMPAGFSGTMDAAGNFAKFIG
jgi:hypothetical protein